MMEGKYKDLYNNYTNVIDSLKEWQMFYIKLFNVVNLPIPTEEFSYNVIFNNNYKEEIIHIVDYVLIIWRLFVCFLIQFVFYQLSGDTIFIEILKEEF